MSSRPQRKYTAAGRRFEDVLRVERNRQIAELREENEKLRAVVRDSIRVEANMFARLQVAEDEIRRLKEGVQLYKEECRRCGEVFEKDEPEMQGTCEQCQRADWEEGDDRPSL